MFPPSLQKNIRELDRQISLLETECENMEAETRAVPGKLDPRELWEDLPRGGQPKAGSSGTHWGCGRRTGDAGFGDVEGPEGGGGSRKHPERKRSGERGEGGREGFEKKPLEEGREESNVDARKTWKHSMESLKEVTENSSEENYPIRIEINPGRCKSKGAETSKEQRIWCELAREERREGKEPFPGGSPAECKCSSDEEVSERRRVEGGSRDVETSGEAENRRSGKRSRSPRTQKREEVPSEAKKEKGMDEKEVGCGVWKEEREKAGFLLNLNESIRTLHFLVEELRTKSSRGKRHEVLNDMQNILMKIGGTKPRSALRGSPRGGKWSEGGESAVDLKKALIAVKKLYQEQSEEKSALTEELRKKNYTTTCLKNKEKEYLTLISNLKFNLEKLKEEVEEGKLAKRELMAARGKLREEAKVIEALKKSHGKMQALIEHYVLENDKLRSEAKLGELETQKFHVLLAGKEAEIDRRKKEIELFQRQITEQLHLLRRKATENKVEPPLGGINHASILHTDVDSQPSETTLDIRDLSAGLVPTATSSNGPQPQVSRVGADVEGGKQPGKAESFKSPGSRAETKERIKGGSFKAEEAIGCRHNLLSSSKNLRASLNGTLEGVRRDPSGKFWPSPPNSSATSQCSGASSYSENLSESSQKD